MGGRYQSSPRQRGLTIDASCLSPDNMATADVALPSDQRARALAFEPERWLLGRFVTSLGLNGMPPFAHHV
jgi:hypothetical protein